MIYYLWLVANEPTRMVYFMENPSKNMAHWGYPHDLGHLHMGIPVLKKGV